MKVLQIILAIVLSVIIPALIVAAMAPNTFEVEREININRDVSVVFPYIKSLKNQENYSVWAQMDPNMKRTYKGTDGKVGFVATWDSPKKEVGTGEQEIKHILENQRIDTEIRFFKPFKSTDPAYMVTIPMNGNRTKVKWGFKGSMPYPMNLMLLFMDMEKELGTQLGTGLGQLKKLLESMPVEEAAEISNTPPTLSE